MLIDLSPAERPAEKPLARRRHRARQKAEQHHHAGHDVVDAVVLSPQRAKHRTHRVQAHQHDENLPEVQHQRVLGDPARARLIPARSRLRAGRLFGFLFLHIVNAAAFKQTKARLSYHHTAC